MRDCWTLEKVSNLLGKENVGLYRDDGLAAINSCSGPVLDRTRNNIIALFKKEGLNITIERKTEPKYARLLDLRKGIKFIG